MCEILAKSLFDSYTKINLLDKNTDFGTLTFAENDVCIIAVPSFSGRVPPLATKRLSEITAKNTKAILLCVYGNRAFDDTLLELQDTLNSRGFFQFAAVSAIAEHSIVRQYGQGRPNDNDKKVLSEFGEKIKMEISKNTKTTQLNLPGNYPYKKISSSALNPKANKKCDNCNICVEECPVNAINPKNIAICDENLCIGCMRCISVCPKNARELDENIVMSLSERLKPLCSNAKNNELFI